MPLNKTQENQAEVCRDDRNERRALKITLPLGEGGVRAWRSKTTLTSILSQRERKKPLTAALPEFRLEARFLIPPPPFLLFGFLTSLRLCAFTLIISLRDQFNRRKTNGSQRLPRF